jgi:hypothetical protein
LLAIRSKSDQNCLKLKVFLFTLRTLVAPLHIKTLQIFIYKQNFRVNYLITQFCQPILKYTMLYNCLENNPKLSIHIKQAIYRCDENTIIYSKSLNQILNFYILFI